MKTLGVVIVYFLIPLFFLKGWLWPFSFTVIWFSLRFGALPLIPLAVFLDGFFGHFYSLPILSIIAVIGAFAVESIRPLLSNFRFPKL